MTTSQFHTDASAGVNHLLVVISRGLLQYVGECWPWTQPASDEDRVTLLRLVEEQKTRIHALAEMLIDRGWTIDFGSYPTAYTDLHFVALDYLLDQLVTAQQAVVAEVDAVLSTSTGDPEAGVLLERILKEERRTLSELERLTAEKTNDYAA